MEVEELLKDTYSFKGFSNFLLGRQGGVD